jgi:peptide/nickel transport system permease protein
MTDFAQSPWRIFWRQMRKSPLAIAGGAILLLFYGVAAIAPFVAPYSQEEMDRERYYHPPHSLRWVDAEGRFRLLPVVRQTTLADPRSFRYDAIPGQEAPLRLFVEGARYHLLGIIPTNRHLFGVDAPGRVYLLGTDSFGRDQFSRLLFGAQISLTVGLVGIAVSFAIGLVLGGVAGYFGGWVDTLIMRFSELLLSIPSLYLIIALRAVFPSTFPASTSTSASSVSSRSSAGPASHGSSAASCCRSAGTSSSPRPRPSAWDASGSSCGTSSPTPGRS